MQQEASVGMEYKLKFIFFDSSEMCRYRMEHRLGIRRLQRFEVSLVLYLNALTDGKQLILNLFAGQHNDLPCGLEITVLITV